MQDLHPRRERGARFRRISPNSPPRSPLRVDIEPSPTPPPFIPALALLLVFAFISLQFILPVTHIRDPSNPYRNWIPLHRPTNNATNNAQVSAQEDDHIDYNESQISKSSSNFDNIDLKSDAHDTTLIFVSTDDTDLRPVAVVVNSTISNTRESETLHFCIVVPFDLPASANSQFKAIFSNVKIDLFRDGFLRKKLEHFMSADMDIPTTLDLLPFYLPKMFPTFERFISLSSDIVVQGGLEELLQLDLQGHAVAAVEDCSETFETYYSFDLLEAAQLSQQNGKPWMPNQPYEPKTCFFDRAPLVLDKKAWNQKNITEAIQWWIQLFHKTGKSLYRTGFPELPVQLALYQNYKKMDALWSVREPLAFKKAIAAKIVHFDKKYKPWHEAKPVNNVHNDVAGIWWKYLSPLANNITGV